MQNQQKRKTLKLMKEPELVKTITPFPKAIG